MISAELFRTAMNRASMIDVEKFNRALKEIRFLTNGVEQSDIEVGTNDLERKTWKPRTGTDVNQRRALWNIGAKHPAILKMTRPDRFVIRDRRQVDRLIDFLQMIDEKRRLPNDFRRCVDTRKLKRFDDDTLVHDRP